MQQQYHEHIKQKCSVYRAAMKLVACDYLLIAAGRTQYRFRDDVNLPFAVNAYFSEFVPLAQPDCYLLLSSESDMPTLLLKSESDYWHSAPPALGTVYRSALEVIEYSESRQLQKLLPATERMAFIGVSEDFGVLAQSGQLNPIILLNYVDYYRAWKTTYEIDNLRVANQLAVGAHIEAERLYRQGCSEYDIHLGYLAKLQYQDADLPYQSVVARNENAGVLHHMILGRTSGAQYSMLIDAGAQSNGYAADITRTYVGEQGSELFGYLVSEMDALQQQLISNIKPGLSYVTLHQMAHQLIAQLLCDSGIVRVSAEQCVDSGLSSTFFPHGVGHLIGVQVHDKGGQLCDAEGGVCPPPAAHPFLRCTRTLAAGMTVTVEPGLYFIPMLLEQWRGRDDLIDSKAINELLPHGGIRVEDGMLLLSDGVENFTRNAFCKGN